MQSAINKQEVERAELEAVLASGFLGRTNNLVRLLSFVCEKYFDGAFDAATRDRADALVVLPDGLINSHRKQIVDFAMARRLPGMYPYREFVDAGGLMSYAPSYVDLFRRAAVYVDRILQGTKPADLPVEQPTKFELVLNRKTAQALGLTFPSTLLILADEVLQ